ncbi:hypothetical protein [Serratia sp. UGAL515B_01]|uniref:hypothetical protein n=1 Tax=Serratia sp. UGAL515B_01 TaxID=2986763 RepID=UPI002955471C|nr:hypothetical protein [Serratia sp. UGAL515B_01]WON76965.1 hypothetical protein OK023_17620 [Serratia sp. UGAL515B_01]
MFEAAMVLAFSAVVVAGVMAYYNSASTNEKTERTISEEMSIISAVNSTYSSAPNLKEITGEIIAKMGFLPASYISSDGEIKTPSGTTVSIKAGKMDKNSDPGYFNIKIPVPRRMCSTMARLDLGSSLIEMRVADKANKGVIQTRPLSVEEAHKVCGDAPGGKLTRDQFDIYDTFH